MVHYFEEFAHIETRGGKVRYRSEIRILCGAQEGEAVNQRKGVTCPACKEKLKS